MKKYIFSALLIPLAISVQAQSTGELYNFSNHNFAMGTARTAAMAGAFTSLGANVASMSINPAGLAMYRSSEVTITPSLLISNNTSNYNGMNSISSTNTKFAISNFAGVLHTRKGFTLGVGYNRLADFNGTRDYLGNPQQYSIGQMYEDQLLGYQQSTFKSGSGTTSLYQPFYAYPPAMWNPIMAYQTGLVNPMSDRNDETVYTMNGLFNPQFGDLARPESVIRTNGAVNEFTLSGAYNINDIVYIGATLGFQDLQYSQTNNYYESYNQAYGSLYHLNQSNRTSISGFGFNLKIGATVRPLPWLRIGVAYHSPTWMTINESSYGTMTVYDKKYPTDAFSDTPDLVNNYLMRSPSRLLAGISFTIAKRFIISADYEMAWYDDMKFQTDLGTRGYRPPIGANSIDNLPNISSVTGSNRQVNINENIKKYYTTTHSIRAGIEAQPINGLFLRAGIAYTTSPYKDVESQIYYTNNSAYGAQMMYTGGVGYRIKFCTIDLTYTFRKTKSLPYTYYSYISPENVLFQPEGFGRNVNNIHQILLSLSFKI